MNDLIREQQDEITAHHLYKKISEFIKDEKNKGIIRQISEDELRHYNKLKSFTNRDLKPQKFKILFYYWITRLFGLTFGVKLLEKSENEAIENYSGNEKEKDLLNEIIRDEEKHEKELISMINEERLNYMGSVVLGLNDALVELTGALAGYTFALQNTKLIGLIGLITGISASFSMAASEYLSSRQDGDSNALKSSMYTGTAYIFTVLILTCPFFITENPYLGLGMTVSFAVLIIFLFNFYISIAKDYNFKRRFFEMASISLGVAAISFFIGVFIKQFIGIDV
ncbi:MAG: VIT1/CCC1 transporter family protein [Candidatus Delongbacteria bacterium]|nr:VIT1/CCC1 transporter family protein [Candidatus Delongbacteria bacterium]MBN2836763.1 VIT1/CCC1 transporter family protein [Candidatus Delongbacteria bacterium]